MKKSHDALHRRIDVMENRLTVAANGSAERIGKLSTLELDVKHLKAALDQTNANIDGLNKRVADTFGLADKQFDTLGKRITELECGEKALQVVSVALDSRITNLEAELKAAQKAGAEQVQDLYRRIAALEAAPHNLRPFAMDMEQMEDFARRIAALEAKEPAPVQLAAWLWEAVMNVSQFAADKQGEWQGVSEDALPATYESYRHLESEMDKLADIIKPKASAPAPAPAETVTVLADAHKEAVWHLTQLERRAHRLGYTDFETALTTVLELITPKAQPNPDGAQS